LPLADATILSRQVDGVVLVVDAGKTRRESAIKAKEVLERAGSRVLGIVLNRANARGSGYYYYYYYYYSQDGHKQKRS
jgi:Mrp family chromosome partitioning ATPase